MYFRNLLAGRPPAFHPLPVRADHAALSGSKENPVKGLREEALAFRRRKRREAEEARQMAALFLACGLELDAVVDAAPEARDRLRRRLARLIERERLRGAARHWSYDLNRHIALKQALDRLGGDGGSPDSPAAASRPCRKDGRARRQTPTARRFP